MAVRAKKKKSQKQNDEGSNGNVMKIVWWGVGLLGLVALVGLLLLAVKGPADPKKIEGIAAEPGQPRDHSGADEETAVSNLPPMGGSHSPVWQNCGVYDEPIDSGNAAHSLEHGAVWIAYQPDLPADDVDDLRGMVRGESHLLLAPYPDLKSPIVLTAWGVQVETDSVKDGRITDFIDEYQQGPTTPERGATCSDGTGSPIQ